MGNEQEIGNILSSLRYPERIIQKIGSLSADEQRQIIDWVRRCSKSSLVAVFLIADLDAAAKKGQPPAQKQLTLFDTTGNYYENGL